jgi:Ohr subfamily peroxiredoxin
MSIEKVLYRAHAKATGGRDGRAVVHDSKLDLKLTTPKELGGAGGEGANPEQLFAAGYSACFSRVRPFPAQVSARTSPQLRGAQVSAHATIPVWRAPSLIAADN